MKNLIVFSHQCPYGNEETFLSNEIVFLSNYFEKIYVVPSKKGDVTRKKPGNVILLDYFTSDLKPKPTSFLASLILFISTYFKGLLLEKKKFKYVKHFVSYSNYLISEIRKFEILKQKLRHELKPEDIIFYSYWYLNSTLCLALLKKKKVIRGFVTRAHGYDLYDERNGGHIPFRIFKAKYCSSIFTISDHGKSYLISKGVPESKLSTYRLGTLDFGVGPANQSDVFRIVSCSNIVPVKRLELLLEILREIDLDITWTHFGDGMDMDKIQTLATNLSSRIVVDLKGAIENTEIYRFYSENPVDLFINVSESEGLPVSIMEAISFGIPVLATDVGGTREIVTSEVGTLIDRDFEVKEVADVLKDRIINGYYHNIDSSRIRQFWQENFSAKKNYQIFQRALTSTVHV